MTRRRFSDLTQTLGKLQCGVYQPTKVISISYGQAEADLPLSYTKRQCNEFMKLALQGHSILVATGDYGVASFPGDGAENGCLGPSGTIFNPQYPNNCPYLTAVSHVLAVCSVVTARKSGQATKA